jgi:hypothetical protein
MLLESTQLDSGAIPNPKTASVSEPVKQSLPPIIAKQWVGNSDTIAWVWLVLSLTCITLAALMSVGEERRVYLPGLSQPLPETCWMLTNLKTECPGCGLTRTFIHMAHGRVLSALALNPVGILAFLFTCIQIPMATAQVVFRRRDRWVEYWGAVNDWTVAGLLIALLVQWVIKLI